MNVRGSRVSRVTLEKDQTIASGQTITVFGIVIANSSPNTAEVDVQDGDGKKAITFTVGSYDTKVFDVEFIADNGLVIHGIFSQDVIVTVFHSQGGA